MKQTLCAARKICGNYECSECDGCKYGEIFVRQSRSMKTLRRKLQALEEERNRTRWHKPENRLPGNDNFVLAIVSGIPLPNVTLVYSYEIASYSEEDGWCIETFPDAKHLTVHYWCHLPSRPKDCEDNIPDCFPLPPSNDRLGELAKKILSE